MPTYLVQETYLDFDQLAEEARQWQLDLRQLGRGSFHGEMLQFGLGNVHISEARFGRSLLQSGAPPNGLRTIAVPAKTSTRFQWRGQQITGNDVFVFPCGGELESISNSEFHVYTCSFSESLLVEAAKILGVGTLDELCGNSEVFRCRPDELESVRRFLSLCCGRLRANRDLLFDPNFTAAVELDLPRQLLLAIAGAAGLSLPRASRKRDLALMRAGVYIERFAQEDIKIGDICQAAQVSQRTLEYAFAERYGITPKAFLLAFRLNAARRDLRSSKRNQQRIVDIANRWGFWHMGQFAADYRKQFGELPSQTLRK